MTPPQNRIRLRTDSFVWAAILFLVALEGLFHYWTAWHPYVVWILSTSTVTFAYYGFDKARADKAAVRIPENLLHLLALLGGFPGGWLGRSLFRHKTRKQSFLAVLLFSTLGHAVAVYLLFLT